jgi:hypothetical protein
MATLTGATIASTYPLLLKIDSNGVDTTLRAIEDGNGDDSALYLATNKVGINGTAKLYFNDAGGEHISSDGTDLTIEAGNDLNLTAVTDINIPANVGLTFGHASNQKIEGDGTDLAITATGNVNVTSTVDEAGSVKIEENGGTSGTVRIYANQGTGADSINIESDGGGITLDAGNTTHGVKIGTVTTSTPVTIGHTTSETTIGDNLTTTGNTAVGGNLTVTGTITATAGASTFGVASDEITVFNPASYTDSEGSNMSGSLVTDPLTGRMYTSGAGTGSVNGPKFQIDTPARGSDSYIVTVSAVRGIGVGTTPKHSGGVYALNINADSVVTVGTITENDSDGLLSVSTGTGFANFLLSANGIESGSMKLNALKLIKGEDG